MPNACYERLTFLDNSFLVLETPTSPMHITGLATFEAGPLQTADGGIDIDRIRDYVASRLHLIPRYRQRLARTPVGGNPVWVDDEHFNLDYHVRHSALPKPGNQQQLKRLASRLIAQHLDRQKPLWEIWILEGMADSNQFVMITKVHHCMVDGMSGVDLLKVLLTLEPTTVPDTAPSWEPRPVPGNWALLVDELERYVRLPIDALGNVSQIWRDARDAQSGLRLAFEMVRDGLRGATRVSTTPLNGRVGPHRRLDWLTMDLAQVKALKKRHGGTVNDIVIATVAGAMRRFLLRRGVDVSNLDFQVMAPVSTRNDLQGATLGNQISAWRIPLPLGEANAARRLERIRACTERLKDSKQELGAVAQTQLGEWAPSTLLALGARLAVTALPFNLIVTNVPGPQLSLYMLNAKMIDNFGFIPLVDSVGLAIVLFSYAGKMCWGFTGDWDMLPDLHEIGEDVEASFRELGDLREHSRPQAPAAAVHRAVRRNLARARA